MGTVYKLSGRRRKPWVAAKNKTIIGYYPTKREALDTLADYSKRTVDGRINMTFGEVYESWKTTHYKDIKNGTADGYNYAYMHFASIKDQKIRELRTNDFQKVVDELFQNGRKRSTVEKTKSLAIQICEWAIQQDIIIVNYAKYVTLQKQAKKEKAIFSESEIETLFNNDDDDTVKLILVMIYTGLRIGELLTVEKCKVHIEEGYLIAGIKTEAARNRTIPISEKIMPYIRYFFARAPDGGLLVDGYNGNRQIGNFRRRDFYPVLNQLGIEGKTPHSTRHTFATMMSKAKVKPEVLQKIIGHSKYSTTAEIYIHSDLDTMKSEISKI